MSRAGRWAGHLPGYQEDLTLAEHSCDRGSPALPPWRAEGLGSPPHPRRPGLSSHLVSFQLPPGEPSSSRSELNPTPFRGWGCHPHVCAQHCQLCTRVWLAALYFHACARATRVCPARCQPRTESGRAGRPASGTQCRRVGLFFPVCFGFRKKNSPNELPCGAFPFIFSAQVSLKGTSLSVSNSFALNSSRSFARAV